MRFFLPAIPLFFSVAILGLSGCRQPAPPSAELATPILAVERLEKNGALNGRAIFFNAEAAPWIKEKWATFKLPGEPGAVAAEFANATFDPQAWRALDRKHRFSAVLLVGDPAGFRPLLDHLRQSPDWTLAGVDPHAIFFQRNPAIAWKKDDLETLRTRFAPHPAREQVTMRVQTAHRLLALEEIAPAKALAEEATKIDPDSAPAWTEIALCDAATGRWERVLENADRALKADKNHLPALAAKAEALFAYGKFNDALAITRRLATRMPNDGPTLKLHAKVAHAARAYTEEAEALQKIIALSEARGLPAGNWRLYLGQAYAASGKAEPALEAFEAALKEPNLTEEERAFIQKGIERIRGRQPIL